MKKLRELHEQVKAHPYRLEFSEQYGKAYRALLHDLLSEFWEEYKKCPQYDGVAGGVLSFYHEFASSIWHLPQSEHLIHTERCIGAIHKFIETGEFNEFYTYYSGCNILKAQNRNRKYVWDPEQRKHIPQWTRDELSACVAEIDDKWKTLEKIPEWGHYGRDYYNYLVDKLNKM